MRVSVLGSTRAEAGDPPAPVDLGAPKQRALLAALAMHRDRVVPVDLLVDLLWGDRAPASAATTLQSYVAGLRRALEPERAARTAPAVLVTRSPGYVLHLPADDLDAAVLETAVTEVHRRTAPLADALAEGRAPNPTGSADDRVADRVADRAADRARLREVLALWHGTPYADLGDGAAAERARLEELRLIALEDAAALDLLAGDHATAAADLEALTRQHPLRERLWALRAAALARGGRQADALAVLAELRTVLDEELGLEPGPGVRALHTAVLRQETAAPTAPAGSRGSSAARTVPAPAPVAPWPLVGRDDELAALRGLLDAAAAGTSGFAALTGEPGIGKSRLAAELAAYAAQAGVRVVVGRCSQDDGAPPLYPWATVLAALGAELPTRSGEDDADGAAAFRAWEAVVRTVRAAAAVEPLLLVLDDLHWADASTLRVLRLLAETPPAGERLLVLATWREHPPPSGPLADAAEALARAHAERIALRGLSSYDAGRVVAEVATAEPTEHEAEALRSRTDGNPFFLVEYARLARERGDLATLLAEPHPPAAVHDVLARRLDRLDERVRGLLPTAAVLGRVFEVDVLAQVAGRDEDEVLDDLERAAAAGLVREDGVEHYRFTHALVRDTALATLPATRRARTHARAATALAARPGREAETAHHWREAGPRHLTEAWRASAEAAETAAAVHAYVEALEQLEHALRLQGDDDGSDPRERWALLDSLAEVLRRSGRWEELRAVAHEAIEVARHLGDVDLLARSGTMTSTGALWQSAPQGLVDTTVTTALRDALDRLPQGDDERRCRAMLALVGETYYEMAPAEREALADEAVAMALRIGGPALRHWARLHAAIATWRAGTAEQRVALLTEAVADARAAGDELGVAAASALLACGYGELGEVEEIATASARARDQAERTGHVYALLVLDSLDVAWTALRGETERTDALLAHMVGLGQQVTIIGAEEGIAGAMMMSLLWTGRTAELLEVLLGLHGHTWLPVETTITAMYCRAGRTAEAAAFRSEHAEAIARAMAEDTWFSPMTWCMAAETAVHLGDAALAAEAYAGLAPYAGRPCCAGTGNALGPVDAFLALAAVATGERDLAARHAERAEELCEQWRVPLAARWWRRERDRWSI